MKKLIPLSTRPTPTAPAITVAEILPSWFTRGILFTHFDWKRVLHAGSHRQLCNINTGMPAWLAIYTYSGLLRVAPLSGDQ